MENIDIENLLQKLNSQLSFYVVAENQLNFKVLHEAIVISNTQPIGLPGKHWVAFYVKPNKSVEFFDSFGLLPSYYSEHFVQFIKINSSNNFYVRNTKQIQNDGSNLCGLYCMLYYYTKTQNYTFEMFLQWFKQDTFLNDRKCLQMVEEKFHVYFKLQDE